jgi:Flp pilus assembly protein TadD
MSRVLASLAIIVLGAAAANAQDAYKLTLPAWLDPPARPTTQLGAQVDKEKLRAVIVLPEIELKMLMWYISGTSRRQMLFSNWQMADDAPLAAKLGKLLDGSIKDVEVYLDLAACYGRLKAAERKKTAYRKAEAILQPYLHTSDPKEARLLAQAARLQRGLDVRQLERMLGLARRAVELAPQDWYCWEELGCVHRDEIFAHLSGGAAKAPQTWELAELMRNFKLNPPFPAAIAAAERARKEACDCIDQVERLGARDPQALKACVCFDMFETSLIKSLLERVQGKASTAHAFPRDAPMIRRVLALASLCPEDGDAQMCALTYLLGTADTATRKSQGSLTALSAADQHLVAQLRGRLQKAMEKAEPKMGARYHLFAAALPLGEDLKGAERHARKAVALDASLAEAWEVLAYSLKKQDRLGEAVDVAEEYMQGQGTPRSSLIFAHTLLDVDRPKKAERVIRAALKKAPEDTACTLALASLLLHRSDLAEAMKQLERARVMKYKEYALWRDYCLLYAALLGLTDRPDGAVATLRPLLDREPDNERLRAVWAAFTP